jgi:hypothetical protein
MMCLILMTILTLCIAYNVWPALNFKISYLGHIIFEFDTPGLVNNECQRMCKQAVLAKFKLILWYMPQTE